MINAQALESVPTALLYDILEMQYGSMALLIDKDVEAVSALDTIDNDTELLSADFVEDSLNVVLSELSGRGALQSSEVPAQLIKARDNAFLKYSDLLAVFDAKFVETEGVVDNELIDQYFVLIERLLVETESLRETLKAHDPALGMPEVPPTLGALVTEDIEPLLEKLQGNPHLYEQLRSDSRYELLKDDIAAAYEFFAMLSLIQRMSEITSLINSSEEHTLNLDNQSAQALLEAENGDVVVLQGRKFTLTTFGDSDAYLSSDKTQAELEADEQSDDDFGYEFVHVRNKETNIALMDIGAMIELIHNNEYEIS